MRTWLGTVLAAWLVGAAGMAGAQVKPGDAAPPLALTEWFTMMPDSRIEAGKVHVVVFFDSASAQDRRVLRRISELKQGVADAVFIAVHAPETLAAAEAYYVENRAWLHFTVGRDGFGATAKAYMAQGDALPRVFITDRDKRVLFAGPAMWLEAPLRGAIASAWDVAAADDKVRSWDSARSLLTDASVAPAVALREFESLERENPLGVRDLGEVKVRALIAMDRAEDACRFVQDSTHRLTVDEDYEEMLDMASALAAEVTGPAVLPARHLASVADQRQDNKNPRAKRVLAECWLAEGVPEIAADEARRGLEIGKGTAEEAKLRRVLGNAERAAKRKK